MLSLPEDLLLDIVTKMSEASKYFLYSTSRVFNIYSHIEPVRVMISEHKIQKYNFHFGGHLDHLSSLDQPLFFGGQVDDSFHNDDFDRHQNTSCNEVTGIYRFNYPKTIIKIFAKSRIFSQLENLPSSIKYISIDCLDENAQIDFINLPHATHITINGSYNSIIHIKNLPNSIRKMSISTNNFVMEYPKSFETFICYGNGHINTNNLICRKLVLFNYQPVPHGVEHLKIYGDINYTKYCNLITSVFGDNEIHFPPSLKYLSIDQSHSKNHKYPLGLKTLKIKAYQDIYDLPENLDLLILTFSTSSKIILPTILKKLSLKLYHRSNEEIESQLTFPLTLTHLKIHYYDFLMDNYTTNIDQLQNLTHKYYLYDSDRHQNTSFHDDPDRHQNTSFHDDSYAQYVIKDKIVMSNKIKDNPKSLTLYITDSNEKIIIPENVKKLTLTCIRCSSIVVLPRKLVSLSLDSRESELQFPHLPKYLKYYSSNTNMYNIKARQINYVFNL